jgi:hypothetical protein
MMNKTPPHPEAPAAQVSGLAELKADQLRHVAGGGFLLSESVGIKPAGFLLSESVGVKPAGFLLSE